MRQGNEVIIARTGTDTCPVAMLESYMQRGRVQLCSDLKLFWPIVGGKSEKLRNIGGISYSNMRELLKKKGYLTYYSFKEFSTIVQKC